MRQIRRHTSTPFPRIFLKNPARWAEPPGQARTRSPSQFPGHTAIGTKALGLLFLRRKVASGLSLGAESVGHIRHVRVLSRESRHTERFHTAWVRSGNQQCARVADLGYSAPSQPANAHRPVSVIFTRLTPIMPPTRSGIQRTGDARGGSASGTGLRAGTSTSADA